MKQWKEIIIYVHGITPEANVHSHRKNYADLHKKVSVYCQKLGKSFGEEKVMVEWGWEGSLYKDRYLAEAERKVAKLVFEEMKRCKDFTINPLRFSLSLIRKLFLYGVADIFYYVSEEGKRIVRRNIFAHILHSLERVRQNYLPQRLSLTCIGHSAGTVILHDFLYHLFSKSYLSKSPPVYKDFNKKEKSLLTLGRELAQKKKLRLRKFYTFGSPITPLLFRSQNLIEQVVANKQKGFLDISQIGIIPYKDLTPPRWVNFWDKDDFIAYPVKFLYKDNTEQIKDVCIDVSDRIFAAHSKYWRSKKVAFQIAQTY
ncbi:MAG: hypothetical protein B6D56_07190 [Candidatus Omnitrophica bacterium 4484_70.1]|nr:MAG: hypothetical protein B6D56_07190 [Candidatus Omnitrophica bacterium 4484_70.1]